MERCFNVKNINNSTYGDVKQFQDRDTIHSEYTFWRDSEASVRSILDELESEDTKLFLDVIGKAAITTKTIRNTWEEFNNVKSQFIHSCGLAKDNLKYISLIMENYKVRSHTNTIYFVKYIKLINNIN